MVEQSLCGCISVNKILIIGCLLLHGCAVVAVADAGVTVVATGVKVTAKAVGAVADAIIPGK